MFIFIASHSSFMETISSLIFMKILWVLFFSSLHCLYFFKVPQFLYFQSLSFILVAPNGHSAGYQCVFSPLEIYLLTWAVRIALWAFLLCSQHEIYLCQERALVGRVGGRDFWFQGAAVFDSCSSSCTTHENPWWAHPVGSDSAPCREYAFP